MWWLVDWLCVVMFGGVGSILFVCVVGVSLGWCVGVCGVVGFVGCWYFVFYL